MNTVAVNHQREIPDILQALRRIHELMESDGMDRKLQHLLMLRASQINQCGYCVKMHTREARADGESNERLDRIVIWPQADDFNEREKAALAWTEALTQLPIQKDLGTLRSQLRQHFSEREISLITATIAMINLWNRLGVAGH